MTDATDTPDWLVERRSRAVEAARELSLPGPKVKGWEFTDLSGLDLSAYEPAAPGAVPARSRAPCRCPRGPRA